MTIRKLFLVIALVGLSACVSQSAPSVAERRAEVKQMREETLSDVAKYQSNIRDKVRSAPGYAVFSNANVHLIFASFSGGYGVVRDNRTNQDTYMKMAEAGLGLGLGVKDFRAVFVFRSEYALDKFIKDGWSFGAHADAAAKAEDKGAAAATEVVVDDIEIYQLTEAGLALQATVKGTKYWKDDSLN